MAEEIIETPYSPAEDNKLAEYFDKKYSPGLFYGRSHRKDLKNYFKKNPLKLPPVETRPRILDAGFGDSSELLLLNDLFPGSFIIGMDNFPKKSMLSISRSLKDWPQVSVVSGSINNMDFEPDSYSLVCLFDTLYFAADWKKTLLHLRRSLVKRGGILLMSFSFLDGKKNKICERLEKDKISFTQFTKAEILVFLNENFRDVSEFVTDGGNSYFLGKKK